MSPDKILKDLLDIDPRTARFIYGGLGVFAAAAIVIGFVSDVSDALWAALYILILSTVTAIVVRIVNDARMRATLGWISIALFSVWTLGLIESAVRITEKLPYTPCYVRILIEMPEVCENRLSNITVVVGGEDTSNLLPQMTNAPRIWLAQLRVESSPAERAPSTAGSVYLQFGLPIQRVDVVSLGRELKKMGWKVEGAERGGERVRVTPDRNEVRYFHTDDSETARALAQSLYEISPSSPVYVRDFSRLGSYVPNGQLEIWLKQIDMPLN